MDAWSWDKRHELMAIAKNADQTELQAMRFGNAPISTGSDDEKAAGVLDDDMDEQAAPNEGEWEASEEVREEADGATYSELEERSRLLGEHYPFEIDGASLKYKGHTNTGVYEFCLATSLAETVVKKPFNRMAMWFELVAAEIAREYLGAGAESIRTGWPSHDKNERPVRFKAMVDKVSNLSGEWFWSPNRGESDDPHHRTVKDEGVDFVVWKKFPDTRLGKLYLLGQCACGNDWDTKLSDLSDSKFKRWFRDRPTVAPYMKVFAVPRHITREGIFEHANSSAGIVFDRVRLTSIAENHIKEKDIVKNNLSAITELVIKLPNVG